MFMDASKHVFLCSLLKMACVPSSLLKWRKLKAHIYPPTKEYLHVSVNASRVDVHTICLRTMCITHVCTYKCERSNQMFCLRKNL